MKYELLKKEDEFGWNVEIKANGKLVFFERAHNAEHADRILAKELRKLQKEQA